MKNLIRTALTLICTGLGFFGSIVFFNGMGYRFLAMLIGSGAPLLMS